MAAAFKIGDKAVHPKHGAGEITKIEQRDIGGREIHFYVLSIRQGENTAETVMVPTDGVERAGLRTVISRAQSKKVFDELKKNEIAVTAQPWPRRQREYTEMLSSGSPIQVARVLRDLCRLRVDKELSFGEKQLLEKARTRLVTELALSRRVKETTIEKDIEAILG